MIYVYEKKGTFSFVYFKGIVYMDTRNNDIGTQSMVTTAALGAVSVLYVMTVAIFIIVRMRARKRGSSHNLTTEETSGPAYDLVIDDKVRLFFFLLFKRYTRVVRK